MLLKANQNFGLGKHTNYQFNILLVINDDLLSIRIKTIQLNTNTTLQYQSTNQSINITLGIIINHHLLDLDGGLTGDLGRARLPRVDLRPVRLHLVQDREHLGAHLVQVLGRVQVFHVADRQMQLVLGAEIFEIIIEWKLVLSQCIE